MPILTLASSKSWTRRRTSSWSEAHRAFCEALHRSRPGRVNWPYLCVCELAMQRCYFLDVLMDLFLEEFPLGNVVLLRSFIACSRRVLQSSNFCLEHRIVLNDMFQPRQSLFQLYRSCYISASVSAPFTALTLLLIIRLLFAKLPSLFSVPSFSIDNSVVRRVHCPHHFIDLAHF